MANTLIQIKRSTSTNQPSGGSLSAGELAYSYTSNVAFIGTSGGNDVSPVGGRLYVEKTNSAYDIAIAAFGAANTGTTAGAAFDKANAANIIASLAFDKANAANLLAFNTGVGANAFASATIAGANAAVGTGANAFATAAAAGANAYMITTQNGSNTAVGTGANAFASATIAGANTAVGAGANNYANATFVKLTAGSQTITGDLTITGNLVFSGNTTFANVETLIITDPLIYLAGNNYSSDVVDIGFIANYVNATGQNVHTGLYREHVDKMYYLFNGYDAEPINNHIGALSNNMTLAVLNADLRTSNLSLGGINAISWITAAFAKSNTFDNVYSTIAGANSAVGAGANAFVSATIAGANTAVGGGANAFATAAAAGANAYMIAVQNGANTAVGTGANAFASATIAGANTAVGTGANAFTSATIAGANTAVGAGANAFATAAAAGANAYMIAVQNGANTAVGTGANTYLLAVIAGANTAVGAGANTVGVAAFNQANTAAQSVNLANATGTLVVARGGTGATTFTANGVLFGDGTNAIKVTAAAIEGKVLQAGSGGGPVFADLDGGSF